MAEVRLSQTSGFKTAIHARDHIIYTDEPILDGGTDAGPSPGELLVGALGACAAITARMYAQRKGWPLEGIEIDVSNTKFKAAEHPLYEGSADFVNEFRQRMVFHGDLTDQQRERLLEIAGKCPINKLFTQPNIMIETLVETLDSLENVNDPFI